MNPTNAEIRQFILDTFDDGDFELFRADYFGEARGAIPARESLQIKAQRLIEYSQHRDLLDNLLAALQKERPEQFRRYFSKSSVDVVSPSIKPLTRQVTIFLEGDIEKFTPGEQERFVVALSQLVKVNPEQIRILRVVSGSILVTLDMPEEAARQLKSLYLAGEVLLGPFRVTRVELQQGERQLRVFLCHSSKDKPAVRELYGRLSQSGVQPWLDEKDLLPGQDWNLEISRAVRASDVVIVCLSNGSVTKTGYVQKEIKFALDAADERPEGQIYVIPLRLEECPVPERLAKWHWVDLFEQGGYERLMRALQTKARAELVHNMRVSLNSGDRIQIGQTFDYTFHDLNTTDDVATSDAAPETNTASTVDETRPGKVGIWISPSAEVWRDGVALPANLSRTEYRLLRYLGKRPGVVCDYDSIIQAVWGVMRDKDSLHELVYRVRRKIEPDPTSPRYLIIRAGIGVVFYPRGSEATVE